MAIIAVAGAIAFSAFTFSGTGKVNSVDQLWQFNGGDSLQQANYSQTSGIPCEGDQNVCMIQAPASANPNQPQLDNNLRQRITDHDTSAGDVFLKQ